MHYSNTVSINTSAISVSNMGETTFMNAGFTPGTPADTSAITVKMQQHNSERVAVSTSKRLMNKSMNISSNSQIKEHNN